MRTNTPFVQGEFAVDYQGVAKDQFLVKGEIAVFSVSLHSVVDSTNGLCVQSSVLERLNTFLSSRSFSIYISVVLDI